MAKAPKSSEVARSPHLIVSQPISVWERDLKADAGGLFKALGKSVLHIGTGKYWELAADTSEAVAALGLKTDPGGLTWHLIRRSLQKALLSLVNEAWIHRAEDAPIPPAELGERLDKAMAKTTLEVTSAFFRQPGSLPFLELSAAWFQEWLIGTGFDQPKAVSISSRLRSYFVFALNQEWRAHSDLYAPIVSASTTPFTPAGERERAWEQYRAWLDQELDSPMFGEPFSLRQLYIPLRAFYHRASKDFKDSTTARAEEKESKRIAVDLTSALIEWVKQSDREDAVRVISGGPGSGKSSVAKMFTSEALAKTSWRALYIPLHRIKYKGELVPAIHDYLERTKLLPGAATPLDTENGEPQLLVVFDGLDELAMLGKIAQGTVAEFVRAVKDFVRDQNTTTLRLKVILTGRTVVMQSLESEFRKEGAVLHLCPYFVPASEEEKKRYERGWDLIAKKDQRQDWWRKYGAITGRGHEGLPEHFNQENLIEVSSEPLLNYLLALADQAQTLDFSKEVTENHIYSSLIHEVYDRRWSDGKHFSVQGMTEDHFQRVLEEIAVASWHGDGRKTTVGEIKQHCEDAGIMRMLEIFQDGAENGVLRLLTAFFFRQAGVRDDENAFEFTHKSFGEYLVARRIVRLLEDIADMTERQRTKFNGWDERTSLEKWARLCGPTALNTRQWGFLKNEMHRNGAKPSDWQVMLIPMINHQLRRGMPMEKLGLTDYLAMRTQSRNAEEAILIALNACALITERVSDIDWPEPTSAGAWLKRLQEQRFTALNMLAMNGWGLIRMDQQVLHITDFYRATLTCASLEGTQAVFANFFNASLERANLRGADLDSAILQAANLEGANLEGANLEGANLRDANLKGARLKGARLANARLTGARLKEVVLEGADLQGADLQGADLQGADLQGANLEGANLEGANLKSVTGLPAHLSHLAAQRK